MPYEGFSIRIKKPAELQTNARQLDEEICDGQQRGKTSRNEKETGRPPNHTSQNSQRKRHPSTNPFLPPTKSDSVSSVQSQDDNVNEPETSAEKSFLYTSLCSNDNENCWACSICLKILEENGMVVECDGYEKHFCNKCIDMSSAEYNVLQKPDCIWRCPSCATEGAANSFPKEWVKEMLKDFDTKFPMLEILLQQRNTEFNQNLDKKLREFEKKIEE